MENLKRIQKLRRELGLTQKQLSSIAGVSQSLITKIETGKLDPSYSKASQILSALENIKRKENTTARQLMIEKIISIKNSDNLEKAAVIMQNNGISQLPVIESEISIGSISESTILEAISDGRSLKSVKVGECMDDSFPLISEDCVVDVCADLLRHYPAVLVGRRGSIKGIITKADLLQVV